MYFQENLTASRINSYRSLLGLDLTVKTSQVIEMYTSIQTISALLYPAFQYLEIVLRNRLVVEFQNEFEKNPGDLWFVRAGFGYKTTKLLQKVYDDTLADLQRRNKNFSNDDFVCQLTLGNWVFLLKKINRRSITASNFWGVKYKTIFSGIGNKNLTIGDVHNLFDAILNKRNRLFHHEPIWKNDDLLNDIFHAKNISGKYSDVCNEILRIFDLIIEGLECCSPEMSLYVKEKYRSSIVNKIRREKNKMRRVFKSHKFR